MAILIVTTTMLLFGSYAIRAEPILGKNIFAIAGIILFYFVAKTIMAHKAEFHRTAILDAIIEKAIIPILVMTLVSRYTGLSLSNMGDSAWPALLFFLLLDPANILQGYLRTSNAVRSGLIVRPLINGEPKSNADYVSSLLLVLVCYFVLRS